MNKQAKSKTQFGVVGAGLWGSFHCKTLNALPEAELTAVCDRFVDAVTRDVPVLADAEDGLEVTRVLTAIEEAAKTGQSVSLPKRSR